MGRFVHAPNLFMPVMGGLIGLSWITLFLWEKSPYGRYLDHGRWTDIGLAARICGLAQPELLFCQCCCMPAAGC